MAAEFVAHALTSDCHDIKILCLEVTTVITDARVPLVKCMTAEKLSVDISFNNGLPLHNSQLLNAYSKLNPMVAALGRLVKIWAKRRHVNDALEGTLSSYSYILLVISYLQHVGLLPNLQDKSVIPPNQLSAYGETELCNGVHDIWFLHPNRVPSDMDAVQEYLNLGPEHVTLIGLMEGF